MTSYTVSLPDTSVHQLSTLIAAINAAERTNWNQILLQADPGNAGTVAVGGASLSSTAYGIKLASSGTLALTSGSGGFTCRSTSEVFLLASGATQKVNVILLLA